MPGIVGCITRLPRLNAERNLLQMVAALRHEGFYVWGMWADESMGLYVGWVERMNTFSSRMPLRNELEDLVLVFSGEEFSEPGTSQHLKSRGHEFDPNGPSYLVHLYEEDPLFPAGLNGRFHGFVADRKSGAATLFNDRYGMHRLYYHESKDTFYFAVEAKAILAVRPELRKLDLRGVGEFVACGAVLENRTLFGGIHVLPPGSRWIFRNGSIERKDTYFKPREWEEQEELDPDLCYSQLREVFKRNLPRYFGGDQPIAMSLTGGLDTRMILAWLDPSADSLPCYTFGSMFRDSQDVRVARQVAEACHQPHQVITAGADFLSQFPHYAERAVYLTDGCVDVSRAPDLYVNERAREFAPVRMTGNYGGEVLRGVRAFEAVEPLGDSFSNELLSSIHQAAETFAESFCGGHPVSDAAFRVAPWYLYGILALEQTQLTMRSPFLDNDFIRTLFQLPVAALASDDASLRLIGDGNPALLRIPTDRGLAGSRAHVTRMVWRVVLEFLFKAEYAYDLGMPQWLARIDHVFSQFHIERVFLGRHKPFHFRVWYRDYLANYIQEILLDPRSLSRPHIDAKGLKAVVRAHLRGNRNYTNELHKLLTLELLHRIFLDNSELGTSEPQPAAECDLVKS